MNDYDEGDYEWDGKHGEYQTDEMENIDHFKDDEQIMDNDEESRKKVDQNKSVKLVPKKGKGKRKKRSKDEC